jgi:tripartite-type tricarboxylate transporter receptor subunit TctC
MTLDTGGTMRGRRRVIAYALILAANALSGTAAWAQTAIKIIMPAPAGGAGDIVARILAEQVGRAQGRTLVIENRAGAGTVIGTEAVARAAPDGSTVLLVANSFIINPTLKKQNYDPSTSFEPICYLAATPMVLVVNAASPYRTLADLIAAARAKPGEVVLSSGGPASSLHIAIEVLKRTANIDTTYVPYAGTAPAINALLGGHVTAVFADYPTVVSQLQSGSLRGLATASHARVEPLPDVPTLAETGVSKYEADIFYGIVAPAKTPSDMISQLSGWFSAAVQTPEIKPKLAKQGLFSVGICGAEFGTYMRRQADEYSRIVHESNIKAE